MTRMLRQLVLWFCVSDVGIGSAASSIPNAEQERARIDREQAVIGSAHAEARAACYQKFEVNQCLSEAKRQQREALAELKRQDRLLNADERKRKAYAQVQKIEERSSLANHEAAELEKSRRANEQMNRQERSVGKTVGKPQAAARGQSETRLSDSVRQGSAPPRDPPISKKTEAEKKLSEFNKKQQEAQDHRADLDKRRRERTNTLGPPLPAFPAN